MEIVNPASLAPPRGYSHGIKASGTLLWIAGQIGIDKDGNFAGDDLVSQMDKALENFVAVVTAGGGKPENVAYMNIYVLDRDDYRANQRAIGQAYRKHMGSHYPGMFLAQVSALFAEKAKVEIDGVAVL